ncbi:DUF1611 domain-containing protein [Paenibacillus herberti]|uniref:D-glutamate N-acetyltransferase-like C-terminal domain-containing protein n=1 Tax=Paenibacillus herberti TaxID=1619309 RepID=A0A229P1Q5_9BACL|nr:DUF1611 domain-containing protein [Paenibacillus herberti]OXM15894.1 hypothetical protein CGZ75_04050 [Paenibacillus herberti]
MENAVLYPFNKITQGMIRFRDLTDFTVKAVVDFVQHRGCDAGVLIGEEGAGIPVTDHVEEALQGADVLILNDPGTPFGNNESVYGEYNLKSLWRMMVMTASEKKIRIVSVHEIIEQDTLLWMEEHGIAIEVGPQIPSRLEERLNQEYAFPSQGGETAVYLNYFDLDSRLSAFNQNICKVGIFATRGCLGKFTAQMTLFRGLKLAGEQAKAIITEPTAPFFSQPGGDIMKFIAHRPLSHYPYYINAAVREAEEEGCDFVLLSGQGSLLPNENFVIAATKISYLCAFKPDHTVLIAGYDDNDQIRDSLDLLRIYGNGKAPFAILIPDKYEVGFGAYVTKTPEEMESRKEEIRQLFNAEHVESVLDIGKLAQKLIEYKNGALSRESGMVAG